MRGGRAGSPPVTAKTSNEPKAPAATHHLAHHLTPPYSRCSVSRPRRLGLSRAHVRRWERNPTRQQEEEEEEGNLAAWRLGFLGYHPFVCLGSARKHHHELVWAGAPARRGKGLSSRLLFFQAQGPREGGLARVLILPAPEFRGDFLVPAIIIRWDALVRWSGFRHPDERARRVDRLCRSGVRPVAFSYCSSPPEARELEPTDRSAACTSHHRRRPTPGAGEDKAT
ncbi:hypothetical protein LZ30DRAFT_460776 [Colletotrichum cereale]|nr:hypothetical protein LZ30DRAFT_460776 [Colletotrichum cereale]